jgi:hypothetical protein
MQVRLFPVQLPRAAESVQFCVRPLTVQQPLVERPRFYPRRRRKELVSAGGVLQGRWGWGEGGAVSCGREVLGACCEQLSGAQITRIKSHHLHNKNSQFEFSRSSGAISRPAPSLGCLRRLPPKYKQNK